jgi:hypothetical protein
MSLYATAWCTNRWCELSETLGIRLIGDVWVGCCLHHKAQEEVLGGLASTNMKHRVRCKQGGNH